MEEIVANVFNNAALLSESMLYDPSIGVLVDKIEKTLPSSVFRSWQVIQDVSCGSRKQVWNSVRKWCVSRCVIKDLDAKSAIVISPGTCRW